MCFSSSSQVSLANGDKISVSELNLGDQVNTVNDDGEIVSSPFLGWLHRDEDLITSFIDIVTENGNNALTSSSSVTHVLLLCYYYSNSPLSLGD